MKKSLLIATAVAGMTLIGAGAGLVNADSSSDTGTAASGIAHYTVREERLNAVAQVLGTTPAGLEDKLKAETMKQVVTDAGLNRDTFQQKVKAQLQSNLLAKGYTQTQIDTALSRHHGNIHNKMKHSYQ